MNLELLTNPKLWLGLLVAVCLAGTHYAAWDYGKLKGEIKVAELGRQLAEAKADGITQKSDRERELTTKFIKAEGTKNEALQAITDRYHSALDELRTRADRPDGQHLPARAGVCEGASGAELSRPDAGFLEGEAARATRLQSALASCYEKLDAVATDLNK